jgi:hypothetical protein
VLNEYLFRFGVVEAGEEMVLRVQVLAAVAAAEVLTKKRGLTPTTYLRLKLLL